MSDQTIDDRDLMTNEFGRTFNDARRSQGFRSQGFRSQAHLDAFYRRVDHRAGCATCQSIGGYVETHDGMQPVEARCAEGQRLDELSLGFFS